MGQGMGRVHEMRLDWHWMIFNGRLPQEWEVIMLAGRELAMTPRDIKVMDTSWTKTQPEVKTIGELDKLNYSSRLLFLPHSRARKSCVIVFTLIKQENNLIHSSWPKFIMDFLRIFQYQLDFISEFLILKWNPTQVLKTPGSAYYSQKQFSIISQF